MTTVLTACSILAWMIATGSVTGYQLDVGGTLQSVGGPEAQACLAEPNQPYSIRVRAHDQAGQYGPWSDALTLLWSEEQDAFPQLRAPHRLP